MVSSSAEFGFREVHLGVSLHEGLKLRLLLAFLTGGLTQSFLLLVKHHFLNSLSCLTIKVGELGVLRFHLLRVDLDVTLKETLPPVLALVLLESNL